MREFRYAVLDVFAERALEGNALAVFADGTGLSEAEMQAIARETNLSETTFVLPREAAVERERGVRVRIFTTEEELPFAGHPTLGTATFLRESRPELRGAEEIGLELTVGRIPVRFAAEEVGRPGLFGTMRQRDPEFWVEVGAGEELREIAAVLGFREEELGLAGEGRAPVQVVSTGNPFCVVPVRDVPTLGRMEFGAARGRALLQRIGARFFYCVTQGVRGGGAGWRGRMQFGGGEDPATGSAAGCVAAWLVRHGLEASGAEVVLEQGIEMRRPSRLVLRASRREGGEVGEVFVGGRTIRVAEGRLSLP